MLRGLATWIALAGLTTAAATAAAPPPPRLAIASGRGGDRLALWTTRNSAGELCAGWRTGASRRPPASFTCFRRGLEPPLVAVEHGGGRGAVATWGTVAGLAAPGVTRVAAETLFGSRTVRTVALHAVPGLPGWRAFTTGSVSHPTSQTLHAYDRGDRLVASQDGGSIHPPAVAGVGSIITVPAPGQRPTGSVWSDTAMSPPPPGKAGERAVAIALADPAVRAILAAHGGWVDVVGAWWNCSGRQIGHVVSFAFLGPASFSATLPSVGPPTGRFSYAERVDEVEATNWASMRVSVDTTARAVVGVMGLGPLAPGASGGGTVRIATVVPPHDAGGPDSGDCWQSGD